MSSKLLPLKPPLVHPVPVRPVGLPRAVLIDAGFTLVSYDGGTVARLAAQVGVQVTAAAVEATEPVVRAELAHHDWPQRPGSAAPVAGGARFIRRVLELARARSTGGTLDAAAAYVWDQHLGENVWTRLLPGVVPALERLRGLGLRLALVSNSEGTVEALFERLGLARYFDVVVDSWHVGVTKPDPAIFLHTLERLGVAPAEAVMVGDSLKADVGGAIAVGIAAALIDPLDLHGDVDVPRFPSFAAFADSLGPVAAVAESA
jgi:HAD superfamily hydrolase (TIGR01509 family)